MNDMVRKTSVDSVELRFASDTCHGCVCLLTFGSVSFKWVIIFGSFISKLWISFCCFSLSASSMWWPSLVVANAFPGSYCPRSSSVHQADLKIICRLHSQLYSVWVFIKICNFIQSTLSDLLCGEKKSLLNNFTEIHSNLIMELLEWEGAPGNPPVHDPTQKRVSYSRLLQHVHSHALCSSRDGLHRLSAQPIPFAEPTKLPVAGYTVGRS